MELTAVLELLRAHPEEPLLIQADSTYVINVFTEWLPQWRKRNMRTAKGKPVKNWDLIEQIDKLLAGRDIKWQWVRAIPGMPSTKPLIGLPDTGRQRLGWMVDAQR